jgi:hypothetical protein
MSMFQSPFPDFARLLSVYTTPIYLSWRRRGGTVGAPQRGDVVGASGYVDSKLLGTCRNRGRRVAGCAR